jgi:hypothetical protein
MVWTYIDDIPKIASALAQPRPQAPTGLQGKKLADVQVGDLPAICWVIVEALLPWVILVMACIIALQSFIVICGLLWLEAFTERSLGHSLLVAPVSSIPLIVILLFQGLGPQVVWWAHRKQTLSFKGLLIGSGIAWTVPMISLFGWLSKVSLSYTDLFTPFTQGLR